MRNLFKMEFLKHLHWIVVAAVLHLLILNYLYSTGINFSSGQGALMWTLAITVFGGGFGVFQIWQHKRSNEWIYLLHRPVAPARIQLALGLAGSALLVLAVMLPGALMLAWIDMDGMNGVEARHYQILVFAGGVLLTSHGLGQFAVLGHNRLAFFGFVLIFSAIYSPFENPERIFTTLFILLWATAAAHVSFKPDIARPPSTPWRVVLVELPVHLACYVFLILPLSIAISMSPGSTSSPWRYVAPDALRQVGQQDGVDKMALALQHSTHPDASFLRQQVQLGTAHDVSNGRGSRLPKRHQLPVGDTLHSLFDPQRNVRWIFSHGAMLYQGVNVNTGDPAGWLGPGGFHAGPGLPQERFAGIALAVTNDYLVDSHRIYQIDWRDSTIKLRYAREGEGRFWDTLTITENFTTLFTDDSLYIFSTADFVDFNRTLVPRAVLDISSPTPLRDDQTFHVMELINGYLVAGLAGLPSLANVPEYITHGRASLQLYRTGHAPQSEMIANVPLAADFTDLSLHIWLVAAPGLRIASDVFWGLKFDKPVERTLPVLYADLPAWVPAAMALVSLACGAITAWLLRSSALPQRLKLTWILLSAFSGLPGLLSFLLGTYWRGADLLLLRRSQPTQRASHVAGLAS